MALLTTLVHVCVEGSPSFLPPHLKLIGTGTVRRCNNSLNVTTGVSRTCGVGSFCHAPATCGSCSFFHTPTSNPARCDGSQPITPASAAALDGEYIWPALLNGDDDCLSLLDLESTAAGPCVRDLFCLATVGSVSANEPLCLLRAGAGLHAPQRRSEQLDAIVTNCAEAVPMPLMLL